MQKFIQYKCDVCGLTDSTYAIVAACERRHLGLTKEQMQEWKNLKKRVTVKSLIASHTNNDETRAEVDGAIKDLLEFETKYNLTKKSIPNLM